MMHVAHPGIGKSICHSRYQRHDISFYHHGILGQKWGVRRYQNDDGTLTEEGKRRYYDSNGKITDEGRKAYKKHESIRNEIDRIEHEKVVKQQKEREKMQKQEEIITNKKVDVSDFGNDTKSQYEYIKKNDPKMFKKIAGEDFDTDDPEIMELVLMEYEEYKNGFR